LTKVIECGRQFRSAITVTGIHGDFCSRPGQAISAPGLAGEAGVLRDSDKAARAHVVSHPHDLVRPSAALAITRPYPTAGRP
jgi:hypothetical protein